MKKSLKILIISIMAFLAYAIFSNANAASANLSVSSTKVEVGTKVNVSVNINAAAWEIHVSGATTGNYSDTSSDGNNTSKTESLSFTPSSAGTYTITLSGNVTDGSSTDGKATNVSDSKTITVTEKAAPQTNNNQGSNANTNTNTNTNTQTQEPAKTEEPNFTAANKTMYTTANINLRASWSTSSAATSVPAGTEVTVTATSTNKVNGYVWYKVTYNGQTKYVASSLLTATKPEEPKEEEKEEEKEEQKSSNKKLSKLEIEGYKLTPEFDPAEQHYSLTLKDDDEKLTINTVAEDEKAKVAISGNEDFKVGNNIVKITVTAEDGTTRMYSITVSKTNKNGEVETLKLSKLQVANATLSPEFDPEITKYEINVEDISTIKAEDIVAVAEDDDVNVTVAEGSQSGNDEKIITIILESKDKTKTAVYQITVRKAVAVATNMGLKNNGDNKIYYILGAIIAVLVILIIIIIIALKKTSSNDDDERNIKNEDELDDNYDYSLKNAIDATNNMDDSHMEYDEMVENSSVKSQILNTPDYNVFEDKGDEVGADDRTRRYDFNSDEDDFNPKTKKKGKHF